VTVGLYAAIDARLADYNLCAQRAAVGAAYTSDGW